MIGFPYGSVFRVSDRKLEFVSDSNSFVEYAASQDQAALDGAKDIIPGDNRSYVDTNTAQKVTAEEIAKMKEGGTSGTDIIKTLISNSDTFSAKTSFAQEKWLKKKEKKYNRQIRVLKATPASVCDVYHYKSKDKVCNLRVDSLAQILSQGCICSGRVVPSFSYLISAHYFRSLFCRYEGPGY
jgi:hypothetical protein